MKVANQNSIELDASPSAAYPELRRLWASVILQAIADMDCNANSNGKVAAFIRRSARDWINSDSDEIASCKWICEVLDIDHTRLMFKCATREGRKEIRFPKKNENKNKQSKIKIFIHD